MISTCHSSLLSLSFLQRQKQHASERDIRYQVGETKMLKISPSSWRSIICCFQGIMRNLVRRYVTQQQCRADNQGVTEDDVNEIKQDISSFRCELMEVLKDSGMNTSSSSGSYAGEQNTGKNDQFYKTIAVLSVYREEN